MKKKRSSQTRRPAKLTLRLRYGGCLEDVHRLETMLAAKPSCLRIEIVGAGEIPPDSALLIRSILLGRSPRTHIVTHARSSLQGGAVLVWLLGDTRLIRADARLYFTAAGPFAGEKPGAPLWNDRSLFEEDELEKLDYIRVLEAINEFLPVKELAGQAIELPVLKQFGLVDNGKVDDFLAAAFRREESTEETPRSSRKSKITKEASR